MFVDVTPRTRAPKTVLVVDNDRDISEVVQTILTDEGFRVSCLYVYTQVGLHAAVESLHPDCVLLDGGGAEGYGSSWDTALWLTSRAVPVVMLSGDTRAQEEAMLDISDRAKATRVAAIIDKPFDIDHLVTVVRRATGEPVLPAKRTEVQEQSQMVERLRAAGALDVNGSKIGRVWATFKASDGSLYKVYRWRVADMYFVGRYSPGGSQLEPLGQFSTLDAVIAFCLGRIENRSV
jgi:FixJ family two-component response regulator